MSTTMVDRPMPPQYSIPHRKPLPSQLASQPPPSQLTPSNVTTALGSQHSHTRTASSGILPPQPSSTPPNFQNPSNPPQQYLPHQQSSNNNINMQVYNPTTRRTLSNATSSTSSTGTGSTPPHLNRNNTANSYTHVLHRSTSARSTASHPGPSSYVALMRKQKATVWCDRAQHEDPRLAAAVRAAKARAVMEVSGSAGGYYANGGSRTSTGSSGGGVSGGGGLRSKIRHHGAQKATTYNPTTNMTHAGAAVPLRLSASEVDEGDSDDGDSQYVTATGVGMGMVGGRRGEHQRTGSGRSSVGSGRRVNSYGGGRYSQGSTPPNEMMADVAEETPVPEDYRPRQGDYFAAAGGTGISAGSGGSSSSETRENSFGAPGQMPQKTGTVKKKTEDELRRRGSVDDRSMTMSGVRLFVANPDADSD